MVRVTGTAQRGVDVGALAAVEVSGRAVLLHTGDDARFGTPAYAQDAHYLTRAGAAWLAEHGAALVGIDAINIDDTADRERPAHTLLLAAGGPIWHLTADAAATAADTSCAGQMGRRSCPLGPVPRPPRRGSGNRPRAGLRPRG